MNSYLKVLYSEKVRPVTNYPDALAKHLVERFSIPNEAKVLDLGCGRGDMFLAFKRLGMNMSGGDIEYLTGSTLTKNDVKIFDFSKDKYPFDDNTFDIVFSKSVIEHLYEPEHFLKEQFRILKPGGRIITLTPDWYSQMKLFYNDFTHKRPFNSTSLNYALNVYGFKDVTTELFFQHPLYWKYPALKQFAYLLRILGPVRKIHSNKFYRFSRELMVLGTGVKAI
ncbi:class I SAM-dependent methyltransferase [bacterium]|nr:class I SAM-dependent methyltransferase [bacterium]